MRESRKLLTDGRAPVSKVRNRAYDQSEYPASTRLIVLGTVIFLVVITVIFFMRQQPKPADKTIRQTAKTASSVPSLEACMAWQEPGDPYTTSDPEAEDAYEKCLDALAANKPNPELLYQSGVSALFSGHMDDAATDLQRAADAGSCPALYFLGRESWHDEQDPDKAEKLYTKAAECGDTRAKKEIYDPEIFRGSAYPNYVQALYSSDVEPLNRVRFLSASYVAGFYEAFSEQYLGASFDPCWSTTYYKGGDVLYGIRAAEKGDASNIIESTIYERSMPLLFRVILPDQGTDSLGEVRETAKTAGKADAFRLIRSSHCGSLLPYKILEGIHVFSKAKKSFFSTAREMYPNIHSIDDLQAYMRQNAKATSPTSDVTP